MLTPEAFSVKLVPPEFTTKPEAVIFPVDIAEPSVKLP
jgi:hypothetical protein